MDVNKHIWHLISIFNKEPVFIFRIYYFMKLFRINKVDLIPPLSRVIFSLGFLEGSQPSGQL